MKKVLKIDSKILYAITVLSIMLLSISYGIFVISTSEYKASELMVGNLLYGISIHDTDKQTLSNPVTVEAGETTLYITISSVNSISSKYTLSYNNNNVSVSASNKSGWNASGSMATYQTYAYTKTVKVVVTNNSGSNQTVTFAAFGGYSYNSTSNIPLGNGYYSVANFTDVTSVNAKNLVQIVEEDTNCNSDNCLYGGEATTNYFTFEEGGSLYRILGTYLVDNEKTTKIAANTLSETTSPSNLSNVLSTIANSVNTDYVYNTDKFNCTGTTSLSCTSYNAFNSRVGILSLDEYLNLEGDSTNSYLYNNNSYYLLSGNTLVSNTNQSETPASAYVRAAMYLTNETQVEGSGTIDDPFVLKKKGDVSLMAYYHNGNVTQTSYSTFTGGLGTAYNPVISCDNNSVATMDNTGQITFSTVVVPDYCYIDFQDINYTITVNTTNASSSPASSSVLYNSGDAFTISPSSYYNLNDVTYSCTNASSTFDENTGVLTVSNVTDNSVCSVSASPNSYALALGTSGSGTVSPESTTITYGGTKQVTVTPSTGYYISAGSCTNGYTISGLTTGTSATSAQNVTINNANNDNGDSCTFTFAVRSYTVTGSKSGDGTITESATITYGGTTTLTVTPNSGKYLSEFSCTNGYTHNASTGKSYTSSQTVTINNNSTNSGTTCTATFASLSCNVTQEKTVKVYNGSSWVTNGGKWIGTYSCNGSTGTLTTCQWSSSSYGNATCNGGSNGYAATWFCTYSSSYYYYLYNRCNTSLSTSYAAYGGGMSSSISCSC